jgi:hypothetical protein
MFLQEHFGDSIASTTQVAAKLAGRKNDFGRKTPRYRRSFFESSGRRTSERLLLGRGAPSTLPHLKLFRLKKIRRGRE